MKTTILVVLMIGILGSCSVESDHDRAERHFLSIVDRGDPAAYQSLLRGTHSSSYWTRYYSYIYLGNLAVDFPSAPNIEHVVSREELIQLLCSGFKNEERTIPHLIVTRLHAVGADGVEMIFDELLEIVEQCKDDSLSWSSVDALATFISEEHTEIAVEALVSTLNCKSANLAVPDAPTMRKTASRALLAMIENGHVSQHAVMEKVRTTVTDTDFLREVELLLTKNE